MLNKLIVSPLLRAQQTANILVRHLQPAPDLITSDALLNGAIAWLMDDPKARAAAGLNPVSGMDTSLEEVIETVGDAIVLVVNRGDRGTEGRER